MIEMGRNGANFMESIEGKKEKEKIFGAAQG